MDSHVAIAGTRANGGLAKDSPEVLTMCRKILQESFARKHTSSHLSAIAQCLTGSCHFDSLLLLPWVNRHIDAVVDIRKLVAQHMPALLYRALQKKDDAPTEKLVDAIEDMLSDPKSPVRVTVLHSLCNDFLYPHAADYRHVKMAYSVGGCR